MVIWNMNMNFDTDVKNLKCFTFDRYRAIFDLYDDLIDRERLLTKTLVDQGYIRLRN